MLDRDGDVLPMGVRTRSARRPRAARTPALRNLALRRRRSRMPWMYARVPRAADRLDGRRDVQALTCRAVGGA